MQIVQNRVVIPVYEKDPDSVLMYGWEWADWLTPPANLSSSTWIVPAPLVADQASFTAGGSTRVRIAGGVLGTTYTITNRITTNETPQQTEDRSFYLKIRTL